MLVCKVNIELLRKGTFFRFSKHIKHKKTIQKLLCY